MCVLGAGGSMASEGTLRVRPGPQGTLAWAKAQLCVWTPRPPAAAQVRSSAQLRQRRALRGECVPVGSRPQATPPDPRALPPPVCPPQAFCFLVEKLAFHLYFVGSYQTCSWRLMAFGVLLGFPQVEKAPFKTLLLSRCLPLL